ncbi:MAG: ABC transporter permease [Balneolales bacterium]|nr:ABC transporter permease [Balneolales bacterium]
MHFNKFAIIFKREYLSRVTSKAYIITTLLAPLIFLSFFLIPIAVILLSPDTQRVVVVADETGTIAPRMAEMNPELFLIADETQSIDSIRERVMQGEIQGYVVITEDIITGDRSPELIYGGTGGIGFITEIQGALRTSIRNEKLDRAEVPDEVRSIMTERVSLTTRVLTETGDEEQDAGMLVFLGIGLGMVMYTSMFIYGGIVMRGVIEEKTSRIVEVIVSSVRPFELLTGKVMGVGALAITQFVFWALAITGISALSAPILLYFFGSNASAAGGGADTQEALRAAEAELPFTMPEISLGLMVGFIVFFLLGYLMYSALFAAVGSALESETENQQLSIIVSLPIIIPIFFLSPVSTDPDSTLAVTLSLIPLFSPIIMPVRMAIMNVPFWEIGLAIVLMILTFIGLMWLSSRIYRVGILMYGKSASLKELIKWARYS